MKTGKQTAAFPSRLQPEKPKDRPLSAAMERVYDMWTPKQDIGQSLLYRIQIFARHRHRHGMNPNYRSLAAIPSKVLKIGDTYYVWYTRRQTKRRRRSADSTLTRAMTRRQ